MFVDLYTQPLRFPAFVSSEFPQSGIAAESQRVLIIARRDVGLQKLYKTLLVPVLLQSSGRTDVHSFPRDFFFSYAQRFQ